MSVTNSQHSDSSEKKGGAIKDIKTTNSKGVIRSTRAQDLRSQSNRDLLRPKTMTEKVRTMSPYLLTLPTKKKKSSGAGSSETKASVRTNTTKVTEEKKKQTKTSGTTEKLNKVYKGKVKKEKPSSAGEKVVPLNRQKTQEIINPKIVKKGSKNASGVKVAAGDSFEPPQLKKSQTFFICKGAKNGEGDDKSKESDSRTELNGNSQMDAASDGNGSDEDINSPKPKPLTHNDSFCLIAKSSQQWSQKNRSDDEKWLQYDLTCEEKSTKKTTDKGILKNANHDLKSVDSLEKVESEKIVRFSDEMVRNKKVLKKLVRRKKRIQSLIAPAWYQRNKLFQKYLQVLREKSILLSDQVEMDEELKPFRVPGRIQERYEAEMFGLIHPRRGKFGRSLTKDSFSY
ncbi:hypothetical protein RUM44_012147 [Polyplax serrata]|uniref:Uncharacterized protein n=1 Tax=Polyplax serrata TaxID=468196 RepID=A0ABR1BAG6_POLSC